MTIKPPGWIVRPSINAMFSDLAGSEAGTYVYRSR